MSTPLNIPKGFLGSEHPLTTLRSLVTVDRKKVTPLQMHGEIVTHYSIPAVQESNVATVEDGENIASDKWRIFRHVALISKLNPRKSTITLASPGSGLTVASTEFIAVTTENLSDDRYLMYILKSAAVSQHLDSLVTSATRSHQRVSPSNILGLNIPWPSQRVRQSIGEFLDRETAHIDAMIEAQNSLILRLKEYDISRRSASVLSIINKGNRLKTFLRERDERAGNRADSLPLLSVSIHSGVQLRSESSSNQLPSEDLTRYKLAYRGDIVLNRMRAFQGAVGHAPCDGIVSPAYAVFRTTSRVNTEWLGQVMRSSSFSAEMASRIRGIGSIDSGRVRTPHINAKDLLEIRLLLPSSEQQDIQLNGWKRDVDRMYTLIQTATEVVELLRERREALITAAVTGRIDPQTGVESGEEGAS